MRPCIAVIIVPLLLVSLSRGESLTSEGDEELSESRLSLSLLLLTALLILCFLTAYALRQSKLTVLHETGSSILLGILIGLLIRLFSDADKLKAMVQFDPEMFFLFLLPPIIFESGYSMKRRHFFMNFFAIVCYAFLGTLISTFLVAGIVYAVSGALSFVHTLSFLESLTFGALISATDPVTVLAIFSQLRVDVDLNAYIFGESVLNDAVAIVLYRTVISFQDRPFTALGFFFAIGQFSIIFCGSLLMGVLVGCLSSLLFKYTLLYKHPMLESSLLLMYAYSSYLLAEGLQLSGIVSILFCGITMAHYTYNNLSDTSKVAMGKFFHILAFVAETFVFAYLGLAMFTFSHDYNIGLIITAIFACFIARAANVFPVSALINLARGKRRPPIPFKQQFVMFFGGLRGAIAFSLALDTVDTLHHNGDVILTTTLVIVLFTVLFLGGFTTKLLDALDIETGVDPARETTQYRSFVHTSALMQFDRRYLKPFFTRRKYTDELRRLQQSQMENGPSSTVLVVAARESIDSSPSSVDREASSLSSSSSNGSVIIVQSDHDDDDDLESSDDGVSTIVN
jgi:solute carrier family 9 (sodium/hydrogen exchanger), member 8